MKSEMKSEKAAVPSPRQLLSAVLACTLAVSLCPVQAAMAAPEESVSTEVAEREQPEQGRQEGSAAPSAQGGEVRNVADAAEPALTAEGMVSETESVIPEESAATVPKTPALEDDGAISEGKTDAESLAQELSAGCNGPSSASRASALSGSIDLSSLASEILADCSAQIVQEGTFAPDATGTHVRVALSDKVPSCYLTLFAYASNTAFDPDSSQNLRLWSGMVSDGFDADVAFSESALPLKPGYSVIACLNVPISDDYYRPCNSQPVRIVDEDGYGFEDYVYPDAFVVEDELEAGAASLHVGVTGDDCLFQAAAEGRISLTLSVAQYPADEAFDFESENQRPLCSPIAITEAASNWEVKLTEPLRSGWRVRAVVYWSQNADLFLPKGNDYEAVFNRPDDSVLVKENQAPEVAIVGEVTTNSKEIALQMGGQFPEGSMVLLKCFSQGTAISYDQGDSLGLILNAKAEDSIVALNSSVSLAEGDRVVAFVLSGGQPVAQSESATVSRFVPVQVSLAAPLTTESKELLLDVGLADAALASTQINAVQLRTVGADGAPLTDFSGVVAAKYLVDQGRIALDLSKAQLSAGQKLCVNVKVYDAGIDFFSDPITVTDAARNEVALEGEAVAPTAESVTVNVVGCSSFEGGLLVLTQGPAAETDADSRSQLASVRFTGAGSYTIPVPAQRLKVGQTVMAHLYKYDVDADATAYFYGNSLPIEATEAAVIEPSVEIVTQNLTADRSDFWAAINFDSEKTARLNLYSYSGDSWTSDDLVYSEFVSPQANSQKITFGKDKLIAGGKVVAELLVFGGGATQRVVSEPRSVATAPQKQKPTAAITSRRVTAGMTTISAALNFDASDTGSYVLYRLGKDGDLSQAVALASGTLYRSDSNKSIYLGTGKIAAGDRLQLVLTTESGEGRSAVVEVQPSPDWGAPVITFADAAVTPEASSVNLTVCYADEYLAMEDFYCDVSVYQVPASFSDQEIEEKELWENVGLTRRVGQVNSTLGQVTRGEVKVSFYDWVQLEPGYRLFAKLRLPHTEWEGEEVDYIASSIPVLEEGEALPPVKVLLYNLGADTARGAHIRSILAELGIEGETVDTSDLSQTVGYLAGLSGFEAEEGSAGGSAPATEFMVMCGFSESLLDKFLDAMQGQSIRIDHKAIVTEYNRYYTLGQLIGDIEEEHEVFQALLALDKTIKAAEELDEQIYGASAHWAAFSQALASANAVLASEEPSLEQLTQARMALVASANALTDGVFESAEPEKPAGPDPAEPSTPKPSQPIGPVNPARPVPSVPSAPGTLLPNGGDASNGENATATVRPGIAYAAALPSSVNAANRAEASEKTMADAGWPLAVPGATASAYANAADGQGAAPGAAVNSAPAAKSSHGDAGIGASSQAIEDNEVPLAQTASTESAPFVEWFAGLGALAAAVAGGFLLLRRRNDAEER